MVGRTYSATLQGVDGVLVEIEASCQSATPKIQITGLPGEIIRESRERVKACLGQLGFDVPSSHTLVHLSPAHARKQGSHFDLPIAVSLLVAEGVLEGGRAARTAFLGELRLDGRIERVAGILALIERLEAEPSIDTIVIPAESHREAVLLRSQKVRLAAHLAETIDFLRGTRSLAECSTGAIEPEARCEGPTVDAVLGQAVAKRALTVALSGEHHLLFVGPPGVGKSLLAHCIPSLLPPLAADEVVAVAKNYAFCAHARSSPSLRPFRSPHHTISASALLGGGSGIVIPGEVSLAHSGVLFLDEFAEFRKDALEGLREPMQTGEIHLHRVGQMTTLPARFSLVAAMNPCPCGYSLRGRCRCAPERIAAYRKRVSGPLLDRFDIVVILQSPKGEGGGGGPAAVDLRESIRSVREKQRKRPRTASTGERLAALEPSARAWIDGLAAEGKTSYRGLDKILRVASTVADIDGVAALGPDQLREAWSYRCSSTLWGA